MFRVSVLFGWYWFIFNRSSFFIIVYFFRFINWIKVGYVRWGGDLRTVWRLYATYIIGLVYISKERVLFDFFNFICFKFFVWICVEF